MWKLTTGQGEDHTAGYLLDYEYIKNHYEYIKNHYELIAIDLGRQK